MATRLEELAELGTHHACITGDCDHDRQATCDSEIHEHVKELSEGISLLFKAIERSGFDLSPCMYCGETTVCIPDGLPYCEACCTADSTD